ncbi:MAG: hypothetical protein QGH45_09705, partial [Myxococcota bacterium]|nr:hypothetical protein [Myxococcota bacterium]
QAASLFSRGGDPAAAIRQDPTVLVGPLLTLGAYGVSMLLIVASLGFVWSARPMLASALQGLRPRGPDGP